MLPWLPRMITRYEAQAEPEARFTRAVDKILPALVHFSNGARDLHEYGMTAAEQDERRKRHHAEMAEYAADFPEILELRAVVSARLGVLLREREAEAAGQDGVYDEEFWAEVAQAVGPGTRSFLLGTSTRQLDRSLAKARQASEPAGSPEGDR